MRLMAVLLVFSIVLLPCATPAAQGLPSEASRIGGHWECHDSKGIHGIFITARGQQSGRVAWQSATIRVYERLSDGRSHTGYFAAGRSDAGGGATFDGKRIHVEVTRRMTSPHLPPFTLDAELNSNLQQWSGAWSLCEKPVGALLERPQPSVAARSPGLVGNWVLDPGQTPGRPGAMPLFSEIHIGESADGVRTASGTSPEIVEFLILSSAEEAIVLGHGFDSPVAGSTSRYEAKLSTDGSTLSGTWIAEWKNGGVSVIPAVYRRRG